MSTKDIIHSLGGSRAVADATGCSPNTVFYWSVRGGIPARRWPSILRMPEAKKIGVSLEHLENPDLFRRDEAQS